MKKNELRRDPISGKWVIVENRRIDLAQLIAKSQSQPRQKAAAACEWCEQHEHDTPAEIFAIRNEGGLPNEPGWAVRVIPESYPLLQIHGDLNNRGLGLYDMMDGIGAREIVIESPKHGDFFHRFSSQQFERVFSVYKNRILDLKRDTRFRYVLVHKLHDPSGEPKSGHAFSHILASPITPFEVRTELVNAAAHFANKERCLCCDIIDQEKEMNVRVVLENEAFLVLSPFAAQRPFQTMILPKRHQAFFESNNDTKLLAQIFQQLWQHISAILGEIRYTVSLHTGPNIAAGTGKHYWKTLENDFHWHIDVIPMLALDSSDSGSGFEINPVTPELATRLLQKKSIESAQS